MTHLMITGASGLLGSNLVLEAETGFEVTAIVNSQPMNFIRARVLQADLTQPEAQRRVIEDVRPEWIIHCAAATNPEALEQAPERAYKINQVMATQLAEEASAAGARFLYISTDSVFDGRVGNYKEDDNPNPLNVYAHSKLQGEYGVLAANPDATIVRLSLFGWSPDGKRSLAEWFYLNLAAGQGCKGLTDIFFSPVYAPELLTIFVVMFERGLSGVYHLPGDECLSKYEFGVRLAQEFDLPVSLITQGTSADMDWAAARPKQTCLDGSKIATTLGIDLPSLADGLARFRTDLNRWPG